MWRRVEQTRGIRTIMFCAVSVSACGGGGDGIPTDGPPLGGSCSPLPDNCTGENICIGGACVSAFPRVYVMSQVALQVPTTDPNGEAWDAGGGAPDLLITISVNNVVVATTPAVADRFSATFAGPFDVQLVAGGTLLVQSYDEDISINDPAFACVGNPVTAAVLRTRGMMCSQAGSSMMWRIAPK